MKGEKEELIISELKSLKENSKNSPENKQEIKDKENTIIAAIITDLEIPNILSNSNNLFSIIYLFSLFPRKNGLTL